MENKIIYDAGKFFIHLTPIYAEEIWFVKMPRQIRDVHLCGTMNYIRFVRSSKDG